MPSISRVSLSRTSGAAMSESLPELRVVIAPGAGTAAVCIHVAGELDLATTDVLRKALADALAAGFGNVDVELSELTFCDSTGLCVLLAVQRELAAARRTLRLLDPTPGT